MFTIKKVMVLLLAAALVACGGGSDIGSGSSGGGLGGGNSGGGNSGGGNSGGGDSGGSDEEITGTNTFYPLNFYMTGTEYVEEEGFASVLFSPFTKAYLIAPVDGTTLAPASNPKLSDYRLTINDEPVDATEHAPLMQKVIGLPVELHTALVIDASASSQPIDKMAFLAAVKAYISQVQQNADPVIKNQKFTIVAFGHDVLGVQGTLTSDAATLNAALDSISWQGLGASTSLYQALVAAIGMFKGDSKQGVTGIDYSADNIADLIDGYRYLSSTSTLQALNLTSVVLFASGGQSVNYFNLDEAKAALNWQSFLVFDTSKEDSSDDTADDDASDDKENAGPDGMKYLGKPLYYVSLGTNGPVEEIKKLARLTISSNSNSSFNFAAELIKAQQADIQERARLNNLHMIRLPILERAGKVTTVLEGKTTNHSYSLTGDIEFKEETPPVIIPEQGPLLEITTAANEYLAGGAVTRSQVAKVYPAVRWDFFKQCGATTFSGPGTANSDGSFTLTGTGTVTLSSVGCGSASLIVK